MNVRTRLWTELVDRTELPSPALITASFLVCLAPWGLGCGDSASDSSEESAVSISGTCDPGCSDGLTCKGGTCVEQQFGYSSFQQAGQVSLQGDTKITNNLLRLTPAEGGKVGAAWFKGQPPVQSGFTTTFEFKFTNPNEYKNQKGADGIALVIQNSSAGYSAAAEVGSGIGYEGIKKSLAVEFDTFKNPFDPDGNHVAVHSNGTDANSVKHGDALIGEATDIPEMVDGETHTGKVVYQPSPQNSSESVLKVYVDSNKPVLSVNVDLSEKLPIPEGKAYFGFTSSTGYGWNNHDILSWKFWTPGDNPGSSNNGSSGANNGDGSDSNKNNESKFD